VFKTRFEEVAVKVRANGHDLISRAVDLYNLDRDLQQRQAAYSSALSHIASRLRDLRTIEGLMTSQVGDAEAARVQNDPELLRAGRAFIAATRSKPVNMAAATKAKDDYIARLEDLTLS
jgi:hypothetical protein